MIECFVEGPRADLGFRGGPLNVIKKRHSKLALLSALTLTILVLATAFNSHLDNFLNLQPEVLTLNMRYRNFNRVSAPSTDVVLVDIDEETIERYADSFGRWPWPRYVHKELLSYIAEGEPALVLFDILFTEPQKNSADDELLAQASRETKNVSHGALFLPENADKNKTFKPIPENRTLPPLPLWLSRPSSWPKANHFNSVALPNQKLWLETPFVHSVNVDIDDDGYARRVPLVVPYGEYWFPSLSFQAILQKFSQPLLKLEDNERALQLVDASGSILRKIPIDDQGQFPLHFYSDLGGFPQVRAAQIFASATAIQAGKIDEIQIEPSYFKDKIVIIGASAMALNDLKSTPMSKSTPGMFLHATALSNILQKDYLIEAPKATGFILSILLILLCHFCLFMTEGFFVRNVLPGSIVLGYGVLCLLSFKYFSLHLPMALPLIVSFASLLHGYAQIAFVERRDRKQIESTFSKYVSPSVTQHLIETGTNPTAEVGRWKEISILFSDIRGFTTLSEKMAPHFLVEFLNDYLSAMSDIIFETDGTLDKYIGDAVMAYWGAPVEEPQHALRAVTTALKMTRAIQNFNKTKVANGYPHLTIGIGIHTGKAIIGNIGGKKRIDYTIIGDNVNLASRIEGLTKQYHVPVLISQSTYEFIKEEMVCRPIDVVIVKGKTQSVTLYEPLIERRLSKENSQTVDLCQKFTEAFHLYQQGQFTWAIEAFRQLQQDFPEDGPILTYLERCQQLLEDPPSEWNGVYTANSK